MSMSYETQEVMMEHQALVFCSANCSLDAPTCPDVVLKDFSEGDMGYVTGSTVTLTMDMKMGGMGSKCTVPNSKRVPEMSFVTTWEGAGKTFQFKLFSVIFCNHVDNFLQYAQGYLNASLNWIWKSIRMMSSWSTLFMLHLSAALLLCHVFSVF